MSDNRDPYQDPMTGDEFQRGDEKRLLLAVNSSLVRFRWDNPRSAGIACLHIFDWGRWAKLAKVIASSTPTTPDVERERPSLLEGWPMTDVDWLARERREGGKG
jgi:hypothetical protein